MQNRLEPPEGTSPAAAFGRPTDDSRNRGERDWVTSEELLGPLNELEQKFAPSRLFISGRMNLPLAHPRVAIVGTRTPSREGLKSAQGISEFLAQQGVAIVSGLARGVDTAAHTTAIHAGGKTIAVLGTPLSKTYPPENSSLQELIMSQYLAVTQFGEGHTIRPRNFLLRNRTMALIADASVIVESTEGGGALNQGWETLRLGRPLFIQRRLFDKPGLEWPRKMADYGAVEFKEPADILESVPSAGFGLAVTAFDQT